MYLSNKETHMALNHSLLPCILLAWSSLAFGTAPPATKVEDWELLSLPTKSEEHLNISGVTLIHGNDLLAVGADEGSNIQILKRAGGTDFELLPKGNVPLATEETEIDIEGIARYQDYTWVIGSHSLKRKKAKSRDELDEKIRRKGDELTESFNHDRISTVAVEPTREWLYRLKISDSGTVEPGSILRGSLRDIFANHPVLSRFRNIPSKENGIDVEGLAVIPSGDQEKTKLLVGLRGPVLRGPLSVVLKVSAKEDEAGNGKKVLKVKLKDTYYLSLGGRGIRGMSEMDSQEDGYLVLAGPVGDEPTPYVLYHWNGKDSVPEIDTLDAENSVTELCQIPAPEGEPAAKAEGVHFLGKSNGRVEFLVVYDSAVNGTPTVFSCEL